MIRAFLVSLKRRLPEPDWSETRTPLRDGAVPQHKLGKFDMRRNDEPSHSKASQADAVPGGAEKASFLVRRDDLTQWTWLHDAPPVAESLRSGQVIVRHARFALTSNNITYAKLGDEIRYWHFFPASEPWGQIPVWGIGEVQHSRHTELIEGERIYGYFPMASHLVITPDRVRPASFIDATPQRAELPATYNEYARIDRDAAYDHARADQHLVLRPLFSLSFFLAAYLTEQRLFGARQVIVSSASSKTAMGLAFLLAREHAVELVGLTSESNVPFVTRAGHYARVVSYDAIETLPHDEAVFIDIAGDAKVLGLVHRHLGDAIRYSGRVGATHWYSDLADQELPGIKPEWFFTPSHILKRRQEWGSQQLRLRLSQAWHAFLADTDRWLRIAHGSGAEAIERTYRDVVGGRLPPEIARTLSFGG
jgi:hypothetical protein